MKTNKKIINETIKKWDELGLLEGLMSTDPYSKLFDVFKTPPVVVDDSLLISDIVRGQYPAQLKGKTHFDSHMQKLVWEEED